MSVTCAGTDFDIFGERTWEDIRRAVWGKLLKRFPFVLRQDLEEAVGDAMFALVAKWVTYPSSVAAIAEDPLKAFNYAVLYGFHTGMKTLVRMHEERGLTPAIVDEDGFESGYTVSKAELDQMNARREPVSIPMPAGLEYLEGLAEEALTELLANV